MKVKKDTISISLTQFSSFATKPGPQQLTVVRTIRKQHEEGYEVPQDIYKQFRDGLKRMHRDGKPKSFLDEVVSRQTESSRMKHYPILATGYKKFLGRKTVDWMESPQGVWQFDELRVNIRPEISLLLNEEPLAIKLWLNDDNSLNKRRAEIITHMMEQAIPTCEEELGACVLDVRRGKLFRSGKSDKEQSALLRSQARAFISLYREI